MTEFETWLARHVTIADCWYWDGSQYPDGYGRASVAGRRVRAHRHVWETLVGPIPEGLQLDHLCRVRRCCNPDHLEPVTQAENRRRGARDFTTGPCLHGHDANLRARDVRGRTYCATCRRQTQHRADVRRGRVKMRSA